MKNPIATVTIEYTNYTENATVYNLKDVKRVYAQEDFISMTVKTGELSMGDVSVECAETEDTYLTSSKSSKIAITGGSDWRVAKLRWVKVQENGIGTFVNNSSQKMYLDIFDMDRYNEFYN